MTGDRKTLSSCEAADLLNVAVEFIDRLVDAGQLPAALVDGEARFDLEDLVTFKWERDAARRTGLLELTWMTEDLGGYDAERKERS